MGSSTIDSLKSLKDELYSFGTKNAYLLKELDLITLVTKLNDKNIEILTEEIDIEKVKQLKLKIHKHQQKFFVSRWWNWWFSNISQVQNIYYFCMARHTSMLLERKEPLSNDLRRTVSKGHYEYSRFSSLGKIYAYLYKEVISLSSALSSSKNNSEINSAQDNLIPNKNSKISWLARLGRFFGFMSITSDPETLTDEDLDENKKTVENSQNAIVLSHESENSYDNIKNQLDNDPRYLKLVKFDELFLQFKVECFSTIDRIICCLQYEKQNYSSLPKYIDEHKTKAFNLRKELFSLIHPDKNQDMREEAEINFKLVNNYFSWLNKVMDFVKKAQSLDYESYRFLISEANDLHDDFRVLNTADREFSSLTHNFLSKLRDAAHKKAMEEYDRKSLETNEEIAKIIREHQKEMQEAREAFSRELAERREKIEADRKRSEDIETLYNKLSEKVKNHSEEEKAKLRKEMYEMFNNLNNSQDVKQENNPIPVDTDNGMVQAAAQHGIFSTQAREEKFSEKNVTDKHQAVDPTQTATSSIFSSSSV